MVKVAQYQQPRRYFKFLLWILAGFIAGAAVTWLLSR